MGMIPTESGGAGQDGDVVDIYDPEPDDVRMIPDRQIPVRVTDVAAAVALIDEALPSTSRDMIPGGEVQSLLLDLRLLLA